MTLELWLLSVCFGLAALALVVGGLAAHGVHVLEQIEDMKYAEWKRGQRYKPLGCTCGWGWPRRQGTWHARRCGLYVKQPKREVV